MFGKLYHVRFYDGRGYKSKIYLLAKKPADSLRQSLIGSALGLGTDNDYFDTGIDAPARPRPRFRRCLRFGKRVLS